MKINILGTLYMRSYTLGTFFHMKINILGTFHMKMYTLGAFFTWKSKTT